MIDTHAHISSKDVPNLEREVTRINGSDLTAVINVGIDLETSKEVIDIGNSNEKFFSAVGVHPLSDGCIDDISRLLNSCNNKKIVAIGETGLDANGDMNRQMHKFIESIKLANYLGLPIIIHANGTNRLVIKVLKEYTPQYGFVFHCFQPDIEILCEIIELGGYISVATPIIRPTAKKSLEVIKIIPIGRLLIELDYPYMSTNPTVDGIAVFNRIRELRGVSKRNLETTLDSNARTLFKRLYK